MSHTLSRRGLFGFTALAAGAVLAGCSGAHGTASGTPTAASGSGAGAVQATKGTGLWDASAVHSVALTVDTSAYDAMITQFKADGTKNWITATVVIDGTIFEQVGAKLKGNSSLQGLRGNRGGAQPQATEGGAQQGGPGGFGQSLSADEPEGLPWRIRLDKNDKGQNFQGATDIVVRANNSQASLNEAVALALLGQAGLANQKATPVTFTVNGGSK